MSIASYLERYDRTRLNSVIDRFPLSWQSRLTAAIGRMSALTYDRWKQQVLKLTEAERGGLRPDASDADICQAAELTATDFARRLRFVRAVAEHGERHAPMRERYGAGWALVALWGEAVRLMEARGLLDLMPEVDRVRGVTRAGILARMQSAQWWRRALRKLHARTVEASAIAIGMVSKAAGLYASDEAVRRRAGQNARNAAALQSVVAVNDLMQSQTLAELAAKGTANKSIRRVELLTRIAGFELIAKGCGHVGAMVTMTCPSRFHRMTTRADDRVVPNFKYDGSTPADAQRYLSTAWARLRAAAAREGLDMYGFRIAEPQHDGTPHWHCILFVPPGSKAPDGSHVGGLTGLMSLVRRYFLEADSPDEPGAQKHRVDCEPIDWERPGGSAVGYIIKYVSKNIDGFGVGLDLFGEDAITSSQRVEAWASTWRIRQFQQIGGAPVGVWRELRRINPENVPADAPEALRVAVSAVNAKGEPGVQAIAWMRYNTAQGGVHCKRAALRLKLLRGERSIADGARVGRFGEAIASRVLGVDAEGIELFRNHIHDMNPHTPAFERRVLSSVESERCTWVVTQGSTDEAERAARVVFERLGEAERTRIHVNNCTERDLGHVSAFAPKREYRPRLRRFASRVRAEGPAMKEETHGPEEFDRRDRWHDEPAPF